MTAVEQLIDQLTSIGVLEIPQGSNAITYIIEQAKEMEKQDKFKEYDEGYNLGLNHGRQIHRGGFRGADGPILK